MTTCTATTAAGQPCKTHAGSASYTLTPSPAAEGRGASCKPEGWHSPEATIASATTVHDPHPNRLLIPDDYTIEDANADFFD